MEYEIKVNISKEDHFAFQKEYFMNSKITIIFCLSVLRGLFFQLDKTFTAIWTLSWRWRRNITCWW